MPEVGITEDLQAQFDVLQAELATAMDAFWEAYALADEAGEEPDMGAYPPSVFLPKFEALADAGVPDAMFWVLDNMPYDQREGYADALERALQADPANAAIEGALLYLHYSIHGDGAAEIAVLDRYAKTEGAAFGLTAEYAKAKILALDESNDKRVAQAIEIFERLSTISRGFPGQDAIPGSLYGLQNLRLGMLAPDFETTDVDGNSFKLSDYRGKVTVVEFWGFW